MWRLEEILLSKSIVDYTHLSLLELVLTSSIEL